MRRNNQSYRQRFQSGVSTQGSNIDSGRFELVRPSNSQWSCKWMDEPVFVHHRIFIRIVFSAGLDQSCDERGFATEAGSRNYHGLVLPANNTGVNERASTGKFGDQQL